LCGNQIYIFGGEASPETQFQDLWCLDANEVWREIVVKSNKNPPPRRYASMSSHLEYLYLFGGRNDSTRFNDLWQFNTLTLRWKLIEHKGDIPNPRASQTSIVNANSMWIYGGNKFFLNSS
jgi:Rab9 effector protein with kelch motifs